MENLLGKLQEIYGRTFAMQEELRQYFEYFDFFEEVDFSGLSVFLEREEEIKGMSKKNVLPLFHELTSELKRIAANGCGKLKMCSLDESESKEHAFSKVYYEEALEGTEELERIKRKLPNAEYISIPHYKVVFNIKDQNYREQKKSPDLILAKQEDNFYYKGSIACQSHGHDNFYYTSLVKNCIYDCEYCYLQGMYSSGNLLCFVNLEDYFKAIEKLCENEKDVFLSISYDTDLLALENIFGYTKRWLEFGKKHKDVLIEVRTKSANMSVFKECEPSENVVFSFSVASLEQTGKMEHKTPSLDARIKAINYALERGFKVRLCFDPIIVTKYDKKEIEEIVDYVFEHVPNYRNIYDVSVGTFRISKDFLKTLRKNRSDFFMAHYPFDFDNNIASQGATGDAIEEALSEAVSKYLTEDKIYKTRY
ncbi:MAG: radical SAM protein [Lachnospiraceae bacterium]|nr:radical SAM protein [Lachnospiraceae bacterium]